VVILDNIFLKAGILTVVTLLIGVYVGVQLESSRVSEVGQRITEIDNLWNDARLLQSYLKSSSNLTYDCSYLLNQNLLIGDKIYGEGLKIEAYEAANSLTSSLLLEKKRYALLDLQFWLNSIDLKKICNANYSTLIYFYSQYNKTSEQNFQDRTLFDFKQKCGPKVIYITFPADLNISTIDVIKDIYNITKIPAILINESLVLYSPQTIDDLENYLKC